MRYVPALADVQVGDVVVTSGLDRIYPQGPRGGTGALGGGGHAACSRTCGWRRRHASTCWRRCWWCWSRDARPGLGGEAMKAFLDRPRHPSRLPRAILALPGAARGGPGARSLPARGRLLRARRGGDPRHAGGRRRGLGAGRELRRNRARASRRSPRSWWASAWASPPRASCSRGRGRAPSPCSWPRWRTPCSSPGWPRCST